MNPLLQQPFFQVTLPMMITLIVGVWTMISTNNRRLDDIIRRLERIEALLADHDQRLTRVEERTSPLRGR